MQTQAKFNQGIGFGVEIETVGYASHSAIARALSDAGIPTVAPGYTHATMFTWKVVPDGSLGRGGAEIVSPILYGEDGLNQITLVAETLKAIGQRVNESTGLHVHHDARDMTATQLKSVLYLYAKAQSVTATLLPTRVNRNWCRDINLSEAGRIGKDIKAVSQIRSMTRGRYYTVNPEAYAAHGTLEFRQHSGSLNATKIRSWVVFTQNFMNAARGKTVNTKPMQNSNSTIEHLFYLLGSDTNCPITKAARQNIVQRIYSNFIILEKGFGSAQRYLTPAQRRTLRAAAAERERLAIAAAL